MKKQAFRIFMMLRLFAVLAVASVHAQSPVGLVADIPFNFMVGETSLPAGEYTVEPGRIAPTFLMIQSADDRLYATIATSAVQASAIQGKAKLVFHQYGDQCFLAQVWTPGDNVGRLLHDVGTGDGIVQGQASGREFRTPPLWGLRFRQLFLHDGRGATIEQTITQHGAEAAPSRTRFEQLSPAERPQLLAFLNSLQSVWSSTFRLPVSRKTS